MTTPVVTQQTPQEVETKPLGFSSFRPEGCVNTIKLLKRMEEEGEDAWLGYER